MELPFPIATYHERMARVRARMSEQGLDGLMLSMPDVVHWLTGVNSVGYLWPQALVLDGSEREPTYVTRTTEAPGVAHCSWLTAPRVYDIAVEDAVEVIADVIRRHGLDQARVASSWTRSPFCRGTGTGCARRYPASPGWTPPTSCRRNAW